VPPGVDPHRFRPLGRAERCAAREALGIPTDATVVAGVSRLVPRKGFDVLLDAVSLLEVPVQVAIAGGGRDRERLGDRAEQLGLGDRVRFLGRVPDEDLPTVYRAGDVFGMLCRERWGGLEAEGFGIVFLEAAACGIPAVAGHSGGSHEALVDGETGFVVAPDDVTVVAQTLERVLADPALRLRLGAAARSFAVASSYDERVRLLEPLAAGVRSALLDL
jgi:phosphatidylinositol alpha-1,6-mannosyltransferase